MSSVLKALREQSSPLLQQPAPIWLSSAPARRPLRRWWVAVTVLLVLVLSSYYSWSSRLNGEVTAVQPTALASNAMATYQLGPSTAIKVPQWGSRTGAATDNQPAGQDQSQQPQTQQQGIDLQQVSPEVLAAFEAAVAAQQSGQSTAIQQSVLPAIADLTSAMRSQIPSFTYDAHQYSSRDSARNVTFSGQRLIEGDVWQGLTIMRITPTHVVLSRNQVAFQQPALEDWTRP
jgi:hypothetical protein